ncbi:MAG: hypothetical protein LKE40_12210 [Spirochaetia bacterium]|nr:hypothetical protein [Spirochaetia bacterium]
MQIVSKLRANNNLPVYPPSVVAQLEMNPSVAIQAVVLMVGLYLILEYPVPVRPVLAGKVIVVGAWTQPVRRRRSASLYKGLCSVTICTSQGVGLLFLGD